MRNDHTLEVVPLGGLGEFGMHMMAFRSNGSIIVVDAGIMFPDEELLGVDLIVPDITYLLENKNEVKAIFRSRWDRSRRFERFEFAENVLWRIDHGDCAGLRLKLLD